MTKTNSRLYLILVIALSGCATDVKVTFIRHGFAEHNEAHQLGLHESAALLRDPKLTEKGIRQAKKVGSRLKGEHYDLVATSPLTRTLETTSLIFADRHIPIVALGELIEFCQTLSCKGTDLKVLRSQFPNIDFSSVPDSWGDAQTHETELDFDKRIARFKEWLKTQSGKTIAVVSHSEFLRRMLGIHLKNCGTVRTQFLPNGDFVLDPKN